jgi:DNA-binding transcriptional ArsR family regulator
MSIEIAVSDEIIEILNNNPHGLRRRELFALCESAETDLEVSNALKQLKDAGVIKVAIDRKGNVGASYVLTELATEELVEDIDQQMESATNTIDVLMEKAAEEIDHFDRILKSLVAIKTQVNTPRVVDDLNLKLETLNRLATLFNADIADVIQAIAVDLEAA